MTSPKYFINWTTFKKSWEDVTVAHWLKYPNPFSNHVLSEDVVERRVEDGKLCTVRFIVKKQRIPASLMWMVPNRHKACYVKETSVIDPVNQECTITTENLNCRFISLVIETLKYKGVKMCETVMERRTLISSKIDRIQNYTFERYQKNIVNTDKGMMCVLGLLDECQRQGLTGHLA
ncbi:hypothetical protein ACHWQZ_G011315 [Mnemiopsis leidyi]